METWDRINEAVRVIAAKHGLVPPRGLLTASGTPWQRDAQRIQALKTFLSPMHVQIRARQPEEIADELDELALQARLPEPAETFTTEAKPRRRRRKWLEDHEPDL